MRRLKFFDDSSYNKALSFGSPSPRIAQIRNSVYDAVMNNFQLVRERAKQLGLFSSASVDMQESQLGVTLKEASVKAYLNSFAGYIAIERPLTQMTELLAYKDMITKGTGTVVLPMLGQQHPRPTAEASMTTSLTATNNIALSSAVVPGSLYITASTAANATTLITDDRKGNLIAQGGVLAAGSIINYDTGAIVLNLADEDYTTAKVKYATDGIAPSPNTRIKARQSHFLIKAKVNKFEYEYDIIMDAINSKTIGTNLAADMGIAVRDEHQEAINNALVGAIVGNYAGTTLNIDLSTFSVQAGLFESLLRVFKSGLVSVDTAIANNCWKVIAATAYVVGTTVGDLFTSMDSDQDWVQNNTGFVNGLLGFYKGRAVLRHLAVDANAGYAIHKTLDGQLAPTALGILLPATDLPFIGNFENTNELAGGIYSVEGADILTNALIQRFTVEMPSDWNVVS